MTLPSRVFSNSRVHILVKIVVRCELCVYNIYTVKTGGEADRARRGPLCSQLAAGCDTWPATRQTAYGMRVTRAEGSIRTVRGGEKLKFEKYENEIPPKSANPIPPLTAGRTPLQGAGVSFRSCFYIKVGLE